MVKTHYRMAIVGPHKALDFHRCLLTLLWKGKPFHDSRVGTLAGIVNGDELSGPCISSSEPALWISHSFLLSPKWIY